MFFAVIRQLAGEFSDFLVKVTIAPGGGCIIIVPRVLLLGQTALLQKERVMMKKFYRFAALILTGVLALSVLVGCSDPDPWERELGERLIRDVLATLNEERKDNMLSNDAALKDELGDLMGLVSSGSPDVEMGLTGLDILEGRKLNKIENSKGWVLRDYEKESTRDRGYALAVTGANYAEVVQTIVAKLKEIEEEAPIKAVGLYYRPTDGNISEDIYVAVGYALAQ